MFALQVCHDQFDWFFDLGLSQPLPESDIASGTADTTGATDQQ
jgi:hypothetical protein